MPQDRLRSPRAGHGRRTGGLSDFEYRVWDQYQLSSDDFGVMRCSALTIQDDNDALANRPVADVQAALEKLVEVGLVLAFEHQERRYICQGNWQEFQKVEYPRVTLLPKPPPSVLQKCEPKTRRLFAKHPGGSPKRFPKRSRDLSDDSPSTRGRASRETANGLRLTADGEQPEANTLATRFEMFWAMYPAKKAKDAAWRAWLKRKPDEALLATMCAAVEQQRLSRQWREGFIPNPATWLNQGRWQDEPDAVGAVKPPSAGRTGAPPAGKYAGITQGLK